jgi:GR25 family glycosyltransferase involved in LPS biosynthesis
VKGIPKRIIYGAAGSLLAVFLLIHGPNLVLPRIDAQKFLHGAEPLEGFKEDSTRGSKDLLDDVYNNTFGFQKVFVVNLASRTDRRDGMTLQAALSNVDIEFVEGPDGKTIVDKAIPKTSEHNRPSDGILGSWRAHMNAAREIVARNLTSALILEDDVDWDVRIKEQLRDLALSTRVLTQPLVDEELGVKFADSSMNFKTAKNMDHEDIPFTELPSVTKPQVSPYGDDWDLLWIGHCGMHFPFKDNSIPKGRIIHWNDTTVPKKDHLWVFNIPFTLKENYPHHTRAVHHVQEGVCTLGYALSRRGALKLLHEVALKDVTDAYDILLRWFCEGAMGRAKHNCLTIQPGLFHHHRPAGPLSSQSNIGDHGKGFRGQALTDMVRWSVRLNVDALANGRTDYKDQFPD